MPLKERLVAEMNEAMRAGHQTKVSVIRMLRASIKNREIQKGKDHSLSDPEVLEVVATALKQREEAIEQFSKGGRQDLVDQERAESEVLKTYLPEPITREQLLEAAKTVIKEVGASGPKDMGLVMKTLRPRVLGRIDGNTVSQVVKELLVQA
jgi:uncharacterized protein